MPYVYMDRTDSQWHAWNAVYVSSVVSYITRYYVLAECWFYWPSVKACLIYCACAFIPTITWTHTCIHVFNQARCNGGRAWGSCPLKFWSFLFKISGARFTK